MFSLADMPEEYTWPVKVQIPNAGKKVEKTFKGRFKLLDRDEAEEVVRRMREGDEDASLAASVFVGWVEGEIKEEDGSAMEPTEENIAWMLQKPPVYSAVMRAYSESMGGEMARTKN